VTKVQGQPTNQDLDLPKDELLRVASSIYTELGGGAHGQAGLLLSAVDYDATEPGTPFVFSKNSRDYPTGVIPAAHSNCNGRPSTRRLLDSSKPMLEWQKDSKSSF
jgi:hypothetical protein